MRRAIREQRGLTARRLQRFKLNIASTVVSQQNADLATMDTGAVLDLFNVDGAKPAATTAKTGKLTQQEVLAGLEEMGADAEYEGYG